MYCETFDENTDIAHVYVKYSLRFIDVARASKFFKKNNLISRPNMHRFKIDRINDCKRTLRVV